MGEEWGRVGVEMLVLKEPEEDEEEDKEDPGDWLLLLDKEKGPGCPKVLQSSMETFKHATMSLISEGIHITKPITYTLKYLKQLKDHPQHSSTIMFYQSPISGQQVLSVTLTSLFLLDAFQRV